MNAVQTSGKLDNVTEKIKKTITDVANDFNYIGLLLWEVREYKYYLEKGYPDVVSYAACELNFKKSATYNFIKITERFSKKTASGAPSMFLDEKYLKYNHSQLCEMLSLTNVKPEEVISPDMTVKQIREVKKSINENVIDVKFSEVPTQEKQIIFDIPIVEKTVLKQSAKEGMLFFLNERIKTLKDIIKSCSDRDTKLKCIGQIDGLELLIDEIKFDKINF